MVEECIRESMQQDATKGSVNNLKCERMFSYNPDRPIQLDEKIVRQHL